MSERVRKTNRRALFQFWICFCFSTSRLHFHYTLSYKRKINIIGKGHLEIGIATYFWLAKLMNPNDNVYNVHSTAFHALSISCSSKFVHSNFVHLLVFDRYQSKIYLILCCSNRNRQKYKHNIVEE